MRFLVDNQLPAALARWLTERGLDASHVRDLGLDEASDEQIWEYAITHALVLISKDEDSLHLAARPGPVAPLVWVRLGNCRKEVLLATFGALLVELLTALTEGRRVVELR